MPSLASFLPETESEVSEIVMERFRKSLPIAIRGGNTRINLGRPSQTTGVLSTRRMTGITLYEPAEMVISAKAGTTVNEIEKILTSNNQMLPFEPIDHRPLFGTAGEPTIGAIAACNLSGPRRIQVGAARDNFLGLRFVNGRGEIIKSGGRVMKNVTGLDLVKLSCGAYGSLGVLTEVTFKVLPKSTFCSTLAFIGCDDRQAISLLTSALRSPFEPSGAAHLPAGLYGRKSLTLLRIEGFRSTVEARIAELAALFPEAPNAVFDQTESESLWQKIKDVEFLASNVCEAVWRVSVKPTDGPKLVEAIQPVEGLKYFYDWSGGLVWIAVPAAGDAHENLIRSAVGQLGGHATLVSGPMPLRNAIDVFQPVAPPILRLSEGIKRSLDPSRILNPGVMYAGV